MFINGRAISIGDGTRVRTKYVTHVTSVDLHDGPLYDGTLIAPVARWTPALEDRDHHPLGGVRQAEPASAPVEDIEGDSLSRTEIEPKVSPEAERSAVIASSGPICALCGRPRDPRKRESCPDKCRAGLGRQRRQCALKARDNEIRALWVTDLKKLEEGAL